MFLDLGKLEIFPMNLYIYCIYKAAVTESQTGLNIYRHFYQYLFHRGGNDTKISGVNINIDGQTSHICCSQISRYIQV